MSGDDRKDSDRESDIGGGRDRPPAGAGATRDGQIQHRGCDHPADRGRDGHDRAFRVTQVARDEFPFQFQPGDEEKDRQQAVTCPLGDGEVQV